MLVVVIIKALDPFLTDATEQNGYEHDTRIWVAGYMLALVLSIGYYELTIIFLFSAASA
ncbi:hypothetical protein J6590_103074, partial [Homalodisca vitripennis]